MQGIIFSSIWGVLMMLSSTINLSKKNINVLAFTGSLLLLVVSVMSYLDVEIVSIHYPKFLLYDNFQQIIITILCFVFCFYICVSWNNFIHFKHHNSEYFALLFFVFTGIHLLVGYNSLLTLFLGAEIVSIPLYVLAGSDKNNSFSNEASLKYFLSGSFFTAFMLLGIALLYGSQYTFSIPNFSEEYMNSYFMVGVIFIIISLAFKTSVAPFHFWAPDVYTGSPSVFAGFMSGIIKSAFFVAFFVFFRNIFQTQLPSFHLLLQVMIVLTLFFGNIIATFQNNYKRLLSYSSIAQAGFMMFAILAVNAITMKGLILYATTYSLASICLFSILFYMKDSNIKQFNGLGKTDPFLAIIITVFVLSLIGIPATGGFMSKYFMIWGLIRYDQHLWLAITAVVFSTISVYYYFKILKAMFFESPKNNNISVPNAYRSLLFVASIIIIIIGIRPHWLLNLLYY